MNGVSSIRKVYRSFGYLRVDVDGKAYCLADRQLPGAPRVEAGDVVELMDEDRAPDRLTVHTRWMGGRALPPVSWEIFRKRGR